MTMLSLMDTALMSVLRTTRLLIRENPRNMELTRWVFQARSQEIEYKSAVTL